MTRLAANVGEGDLERLHPPINVSVGDARNLQAYYNIAPTDKVEVMRLGEGGAAELVPMRWGFSIGGKSP